MNLRTLGTARATARATAQPRRGPGRPPGATNKTTNAWRDFLLANYSSPLQAMAEAYSMPTEDLAERLGCARLEAFKLQLAAARDLAPYIHSRMPLAIQADVRSVTLVVADGGSPPAEQAADGPLTATVLPVDQADDSGEDDATNSDT